MEGKSQDSLSNSGVSEMEGRGREGRKRRKGEGTKGKETEKKRKEERKGIVKARRQSSTTRTSKKMIHLHWLKRKEMA